MKTFTKKESVDAVRALATTIEQADRLLHINAGQRGALVRAVLKTIAPKNGKRPKQGGAK